MGRRIIKARGPVLGDADLQSIILPGDLQKVYALAVGSTSEPGSYVVEASNMPPFILDNRHPFIGEEGPGNLFLAPPLIIRPNWSPLNTPGEANAAALDLMLYDRVPNWLPRGRAVLDSVTDLESDGEDSHTMVVQGRRYAVVITRAILGPVTVRYGWKSFDFPLMSGDYAFTDIVNAGATVIREISFHDAIQGAGEVESGLADLLTVRAEIGGEDPGPTPAYFVMEAYDD